MRENGSSDVPKQTNHDSGLVSDVLRLLEASKIATDADQPLAASRSTDDSVADTVSSSHLPTSSLSLAVDDVAQQLLDGLVLGSARGGTNPTVTPRIDAALTRMVGSQALSLPPEPSLASLQAMGLSRTAPTSPVQPAAISPTGLMMASGLGGTAQDAYASTVLVNPLTLSPGHSSSVSSPLQQAPVSLSATAAPTPPGNGAAIGIARDTHACIPAMSIPPTDFVLGNIRAFSDAMLAQQQAQLLRTGMLPTPPTPGGLGSTAPPRLSSVEMMVEVMQRLPRRESAVPHVAAHLYHLDKQVFWNTQSCDVSGL